MGLRQDILPYIDGNGMVAPNKQVNPVGRGSDNSPMFTSEYFVMLEKMGDLQQSDIDQFNRLIGACVTSDGLLNRAPVGTDSDQIGPDDFYGVLNGCKHTSNTDIPRRMLKAVFKYMGFLNNGQPGVKTWPSFLVRQVQMIAAMVAAAFPSYWNPIHWLVRLLAFPFFFAAAVVIFVSCIEAPMSDTDSRRLSWHLLQAVKPVSLMCKFASLFWYHRLYSVYGTAGMKGVAKLYYQPGHPFATYWQD